MLWANSIQLFILPFFKKKKKNCLFYLHYLEYLQRALLNHMGKSIKSHFFACQIIHHYHPQNSRLPSGFAKYIIPDIIKPAGHFTVSYFLKIYLILIHYEHIVAVFSSQLNSDLTIKCLV